MAELPSAPLAEAEELVLESSFPRGLASAECFEARAPVAYLRPLFHLPSINRLQSAVSVMFVLLLPLAAYFAGALNKLWLCCSVRNCC